MWECMNLLSFLLRTAVTSALVVFKATPFSSMLCWRTPQIRKCTTPTLFLPLSQVTEHKWEPAKSHLHSNRLHGAQCSWANGQRRGESCDGYLGDSSETHILHIHPSSLLLTFLSSCFMKLIVNVCCTSQSETTLQANYFIFYKM